MWRVAVGCLLSLWVLPAQTAEYMEKTPFQLSRAFSPGVVTDGGKIVWVAGQTATRDKDEKDISGNFDAQVRQVFGQIDAILKRAGGSLANVVSMTVFIKEPRYGDRFVEMRKDYFHNGNYPGSPSSRFPTSHAPASRSKYRLLASLTIAARTRIPARPKGLRERNRRFAPQTGHTLAGAR